MLLPFGVGLHQLSTFRPESPSKYWGHDARQISPSLYLHASHVADMGVLASAGERHQVAEGSNFVPGEKYVIACMMRVFNHVEQSMTYSCGFQMM